MWFLCACVRVCFNYIRAHPPVFHLYAQREARERERARARERAREIHAHTLFMAPIVDAIVAASLLATPTTASIRAFLGASYLRVCRTN
jgi:hypothetical protein